MWSGSNECKCFWLLLFSQGPWFGLTQSIYVSSLWLPFPHQLPTWISRRLFTWSILSKWFFMPPAVVLSATFHWEHMIPSFLFQGVDPILDWSWHGHSSLTSTYLQIWYHAYTSPAYKIHQPRYIWWQHVFLIWSIGPVQMSPIGIANDSHNCRSKGSQGPLQIAFPNLLTRSYEHCYKNLPNIENLVAKKKIAQKMVRCQSRDGVLKSVPSTPLRRCLHPSLKWALEREGTH